MGLTRVTQKVKFVYWMWALENYANGGEHYYQSLKLNSPRRWFSVRNAL